MKAGARGNPDADGLIEKLLSKAAANGAWSVGVVLDRINKINRIRRERVNDDRINAANPVNPVY
jgi:hypothetical protein